MIYSVKKLTLLIARGELDNYKILNSIQISPRSVTYTESLYFMVDDGIYFDNT